MSEMAQMYGIEVGDLVDVRCEVLAIDGDMAEVSIFHHLRKAPIVVRVPIAAMEAARNVGL